MEKSIEEITGRIHSDVEESRREFNIGNLCYELINGKHSKETIRAIYELLDEDNKKKLMQKANSLLESQQ